MSDQDKPSPRRNELAATRGTLQDLRMRRVAPTPSGRDAYENLRRHVAGRLLAAPDSAPPANLAPPPRPKLQARLDNLLFEDRILLKRAEKLRLLEDVLVDVYGLGPLADLLADPSVQAITVRGAGEILVLRDGRSAPAERPFYDEAHLAHIVARLGAQAENGRVALPNGLVAHLRPAHASAAEPLVAIARPTERDPA